MSVQQIGVDFVMNSASSFAVSALGLDTMVQNAVGTNNELSTALTSSLISQGVKFGGKLMDVMGVSWLPHSYQTPQTMLEFAENVATDTAVMYFAGPAMADALNGVLPSDDPVSSAIKSGAMITAADVASSAIKQTGVINFFERETRIIY
jgi:hypothetical protein